MSFQAQVQEFHEACRFHVGEFGEIPPLEVRRSRATLIREEMEELIAELLSDDPDTLIKVYGIKPPGATDGNPFEARPVDPVKVAHEGADAAYVVTGAFVNFGVDMVPPFEVVHAANMQKAYLTDRDVGDENGKARKPLNWQSADVSSAMRPYQRDTDNAEQAARWLAEKSGSPRYQGQGWRLLLTDRANAEHAARLAAGFMLPGGSSQDVTDARDVLIEHMRNQA